MSMGLAGACPAVSLACVPVAAVVVPPSEEERPSLFTSCRSQEVPADFSRAICGQSGPLEGGMGAGFLEGCLLWVEWGTSGQAGVWSGEKALDGLHLAVQLEKQWLLAGL